MGRSLQEALSSDQPVVNCLDGKRFDIGCFDKLFDDMFFKSSIVINTAGWCCINYPQVCHEYIYH